MLTMEAVCSGNEDASPVQPNHDEKMRKTLTEAKPNECQENVDNTDLLGAHTAETTEEPIIEQEVLIVKQETGKTTDMDDKEDILFYISESEMENKGSTFIANVKDKAQTEEREAPLLMSQDVEIKLVGISDNHKNVRNNPEKVIETDIKMSFNECRGHLVQRISDKELEVNINQVKFGGSNPSQPTGTQNEQISCDDLQLKSLNQDPEIPVGQMLYQDPQAVNEQIPNTKPELIFDKDTKTQLQNIPDKEPENKSIAPEALKTQLEVTDQATNRETQVTRTPEQDLVKSENSGLRTEEVPGKNEMESLSIVRNVGKDASKANTQILEEKLSRTAAEKGIQVNDIILKTHRTASAMSSRGTQDVSILGEREAKTSVEGLKSLKTTSSKSYKTLKERRPSCQMLNDKVHSPKVSAQRDFLDRSTRRWKWWEVSQDKNRISMDHKVPREQTILVQSPSQMSQTAKSFQYNVSSEMLKFMKTFPGVNLKSDLVEAFQDAFNFFRKDKTKRVNMNDLQYTLSTMGIYLTHQDTFEALKSADIDGDGKVDFCDFLAVLTDDQRFFSTVGRRWLLPVSEQEYLDTVLFDAISRLLQKCCLLRKSTAEISDYYQQKFETIPQPSKLKGSKSRVMVDFARGTRIMGMTDRQLVLYLEEIKSIKGSCVGSPYDVIPSVPLCTKMVTKLSRRPHIPRLLQKNIYKGDKETSDLDMQIDVRGMTHRGIQVDIYIPGCKRKFNPIAIDLRLSISKLQKLNMNDHGLVRHRVDVGKKRFLKRATQRKMSSMLHFWDKIQGGQIDEETRNPIFYSIFSTYSWPWDAQRELLAKQQLWHWETVKNCETASSPLGTGLQWSYMDRYCSKDAGHSLEYQGQWIERDAECAEVLNKSSCYLPENPNEEQKPDKDDAVEE